MVISPVVPFTSSPLDKAFGSQTPQQYWINTQGESSRLWSGEGYFPQFTPSWILPRDGGWRIGENPSDPNNPDPERHSSLLDLTITDYGRAFLFCGRAGQVAPATDMISFERLVIAENAIVALTTQALFMLGRVYADAGYLGPVNVGVAITGLIGYPLTSMHLAAQAAATTVLALLSAPLIPRSEDLLRTTRVDMAPDLIDKPEEIVRSILGKFISGVTKNRYDPFSKVQKIAR
jgi:hypothetical protein